MFSGSKTFRISVLDKILFYPLLFLVCLLILTANARGGFLYTLNERNGAANQIYGFSVNETTGALVPLAGFPVPSGGNGSSVNFSEMMTIDRANFRLYVLNLHSSSNNLSAFSINPANGSLTALPYSPIALPAGNSWRTVSVHPTGSPVIVGDGTGSRVVSINVTAASAAQAAGSPFTSGTSRAFSSAFSRDGNFLYSGGSLTTTTFAGFSVNPATGVLTPLPGSAFESGAVNPDSYAIDSRGRLFMTNAGQNQLRVFSTDFGIPTAATGNPFTAGLTLMLHAVLHPNERFYYVSDFGGERVGAYEITGSGTATTLAPVSGSPVNSGGTDMATLALNNAGTFLFAAHITSRNIATYAVTPSTGALTFNNIQPANTVGVDGKANGMAYLPNVFPVSNANDTGTGSLRQVVLDANAAGGGIIFFHPNTFNVPRTISLTSGQISIFSNITINGTGPERLTIRVAGTLNSFNRAFNVGTGAAATIRGMTLTGGNVLNPGGAIFNTGMLTLSDCLITGNTAASFGGGIRNQGTTALMNIINSTISGNISNGTGSSGGGIDNSATMNITNSTISGNTKNNGTNNGGGIWNSGTLTVTNSTITNNTAADSGASGIFRSAGTVTVRNTIIAGNQNNASIPDVSGAFTSSGFNFIGNVGAATGFNQTGDQTGTGASPLDPGLVKVLALNGGSVPTHALIPNSAAVDKGSNSNITFDQRKFTRPFDNLSIPNTADGADIGAFERRALESIFTAPFDFDGDNKTDISIFRPSVGEWWINRSSSGQTFAAQFGTAADELTPGDFTGDGRTDIAFWRPSNGFWFVLRSENFTFFSFPFGTGGDIPAPADFDGDAKTDAAVFRPSSATWFISNSSGGTTIQTFGASGDAPVPGDYDGDGRADIAIYRPSNGQWWLNRSTTGVIAVTFGGSGDKALPGDFTGDRLTDVAFWRPSTGEWFVLRSEDFSFFSFPFGTNNDIPLQGDFDGDGRADAAIFRPSNSTWFIQRTSAGTLIQTFGSTGDVPVASAFVP